MNTDKAQSRSACPERGSSVIEQKGFCSKCHKVWALEKGQGVCQWCGKLATCQTRRTQALRSFKSRSNGRKRQAEHNGNGYDHLSGEWAEWYRIAKLYARKVPPVDQPDVCHDILITLYEQRQRDGKPLPELRAYKIASITVALYWRRQSRSTTQVCTYNGYAQATHCTACDFRERLAEHSARRCPFVGVRPTLSLDSPAGTIDGLAVTLKDILILTS